MTIGIYRAVLPIDNIYHVFFDDSLSEADRWAAGAFAVVQTALAGRMGVRFRAEAVARTKLAKEGSARDSGTECPIGTSRFISGAVGRDVISSLKGTALNRSHPKRNQALQIISRQSALGDPKACDALAQIARQDSPTGHGARAVFEYLSDFQSLVRMRYSLEFAQAAGRLVRRVADKVMETLDSGKPFEEIMPILDGYKEGPFFLLSRLSNMGIRFEIPARTCGFLGLENGSGIPR